jgi:hypothetical protein
MLQTLSFCNVLSILINSINKLEYQGLCHHHQLSKQILVLSQFVICFNYKNTQFTLIILISIKYSIHLLIYFFVFCRPVSAYALFFRDTQAAIKGQNPNASFGEVSKIVASMWDVLATEHKNVS